MFISVIVGLAVTHLVVGIVGLIQARREVRVYWVHLLWVGFTLSWLVDFWWFFFSWQALPEWTFDSFRLFLAYAVIVTLVAGLLFPVRGETTDYEAFFFSHHRWFFGLILSGNALDVVEVFRKADLGIRPVPDLYVGSMALLSVALVGGLLTSNRRYHAFLSAFSLLWALGYAAAVYDTLVG